MSGCPVTMIQTVSDCAIFNEAGFVEKVRAASEVRQKDAEKELARKINRDRKRSAELDKLIPLSRKVERARVRFIPMMGEHGDRLPDLSDKRSL